MVTWSLGVPFCGKREAAVFPAGSLGERLLLALYIYSGSVYFAVALALEIVEMLLELVEIGYTGAGGFVGPAPSVSTALSPGKKRGHPYP